MLLNWSWLIKMKSISLNEFLMCKMYLFLSNIQRSGGIFLNTNYFVSAQVRAIRFLYNPFICRKKWKKSTWVKNMIVFRNVVGGIVRWLIPPWPFEKFSVKVSSPTSATEWPRARAFTQHRRASLNLLHLILCHGQATHGKLIFITLL